MHCARPLTTDKVLPLTPGSGPRLAFLQDANDLTLREPILPHGDSFQSYQKSNILWSGSRGSVPGHLALGAHLARRRHPRLDALDHVPGRRPQLILFQSPGS